MHLKEQILKYKAQKKGIGWVAKQMRISEEEVRQVLKDDIMENGTNFVHTVGTHIPAPSEYTVTYSHNVNNDKGTLQSELVLDYEPKDDVELAELHKVDLTKYKISSYWTKQQGEKFFSSLHCTLKKVEKEPELQKDILLKELMEYSKYVPYYKPNKRAKYSYEINIPDVHFGKLAWKEESGEDYDLKIAETRYEKAIENLLSLVDTDQLEEIVFPIGNDMINIDSRRNETFAGTGQDSDSRFFKIVQVVKEILIRNINSLSLICPVKVIVISGNHDPETMFMLGEIMSAYYHNNKNVTVDNSPSQRKYYSYGKNGFQYTHGNEEKHGDLGLIFATERPELWASTEYRFCKLGHFHKNKKISYLSIDEHQGFQVQILPSLSGSDAWHNSKGYMSKRQAKGFLYHKENGQIAEYTYNV